MAEEKIKIPSIITVGELANCLNIPVSKVIAELMKNGIMATINELIDFETAEIVAEFLGFHVEKIEEEVKGKNVCQEKNLKERPPVVAILGHVDHGKTSLLDKIRETNVAAKESGGITQHIGAYQVNFKGKKITFLDTPGHEAFEAMRAHGASITDIAIIIVAADDGVKPQTIEAIKHAQAANTPILVAINKIDKPGADSLRVKKQFAEIGLTPHEWGGKIDFVEVSAKTGQGIDKLLETILAMAEILELRADDQCLAQGVVIESRLETGKGPVASILIQNGKLTVGQWVQVGETYGKLKAMEDENGKRLKEALPSMAVKIIGLKAVPQVADMLQVFESEKEAQEESNKTKKFRQVKKLSGVKTIDLQAISEQIASEDKNELNLVVKADVVGSLEAIKENLVKLSNKYIKVNFIGEGVGAVSESDVQMAATSDKIIVSFKVGNAPGVDSLAKAKSVKILKYDIIYELIDDVKNIIRDMLPSEKIEIPLGKMKVLAVFKISGNKSVIGGKIEDGKAEKNSWVRVERDGVKIADYLVSSLQREKEEVDSVSAGTECGIGFNAKVDIKKGDNLEFYKIEEKKVSLE